MSVHYLDNSATTQVSERAGNKALYIMREEFGNPSSLHAKGFSASMELETARNTIAEAVGADSSEIYFTSGGTEANNLAILGAAAAHRRRGKRIVTTAAEHSSVYDSMTTLKSEGFDVIFLKPDLCGHIDLNELYDAINEDTILVSVMYINNETGVINPISNIAAAIRRKQSPALLHTDAVQAFGKVQIKVSKLRCDLLTISGHKVHGPKGVGALYVKKGVRILPRIYGGNQEKKLRPGTESLPLICAFAEAVSELDIQNGNAIVTELNSYLRDRLSGIEDITINSPNDASPYIINFSVKGIRSETMLHHLSKNEVYVSSSSACSKGAKSHVLTAMGLSSDIIDSAVRVSFSKYNTFEDCDALIAGITEGLAKLARR